jgi:hypothetical protein
MGSTLAMTALMGMNAAQQIQESRAAEKQAALAARARDAELQRQQEQLRVAAENRRRQADLAETRATADEAGLRRRFGEDDADRGDRLRRAMASEKARAAASGFAGTGGSSRARLRSLLDEAGRAGERAGMDLAARIEEARAGRLARRNDLAAAEETDRLSAGALAGRRRSNLLQLAETRRNERLNRMFAIGRSAAGALKG